MKLRFNVLKPEGPYKTDISRDLTAYIGKPFWTLTYLTISAKSEPSTKNGLKNAMNEDIMKP